MKDTLLNIFYIIALAGIVQHFILNLVTLYVLKLSQTETDEIYSSSPFVFRGMRSMRVRLFLPWVPVHSIAERPTHIRFIVWAERLGGLVIFLGFLGMAATYFLSFIVKA